MSPDCLLDYLERCVQRVEQIVTSSSIVFSAPRVTYFFTVPLRMDSTWASIREGNEVKEL
ncbi:MAG: hypothetical protein QW062_02625 [Thermoplasmatales archaeon]